MRTSRGIVCFQQGTGLYTSDISRHAMAVGLRPGTCAIGQQQQLAESDAMQRRMSGTLPDVMGATVQHEVADAAVAPGVPESSNRRRRLERSESLSCESSLAPGLSPTFCTRPSCSCGLRLDSQSQRVYANSGRVQYSTGKKVQLSPASSQQPSVQLKRESATTLRQASSNAHAALWLAPSPRPTAWASEP